MEWELVTHATIFGIYNRISEHVTLQIDDGKVTLCDVDCDGSKLESYL